MRIRGAGRLRRIAGRFKKKPGSGALILLYHRVAEPRTDPWHLSVSPRHFDEHLEVLQKHARPISLQQLSRGRDVADRSVAVTFDDGYADNLHDARPLLERRGIPATFFLTAGYLGQEREFWWDELDRLLLQPGTLPQTLRLGVNGSIHRWWLGRAARYGGGARWNPRWRRAWGGAPGPRRRLYLSLWELLYPLEANERRRVLDELLEWAGAGPAGRETHRPLSLEEVGVLARGELVEIGAHTVTHAALPLLPTASRQAEIRNSKARLEEILDRPVTSFSYPYGNFSPETVATVREAGFAYACSASAGVVRKPGGPFQLPRVFVKNWDGKNFARRLAWWFND